MKRLVLIVLVVVTVLGLAALIAIPTLADTGPTISTDQPGYNPGDTVYITGSNAGSPTLTASSTGLASGTQTESVQAPLRATKLFISGPVSFQKGTASGQFTAQIQDALGNPFTVTTNTQINLYTTSGLGRFDTSAGGAFNGSVTKITVAAGSSSVTFYYKDSKAGTPTITLTSTGLTSTFQVETITP